MDFTALTPAKASITTLGTLLGPLGLIAMVATLLTLGVLIVGLIAERRETASIRRLAANRRPIVLATSVSRRQAA